MQFKVFSENGKELIFTQEELFTFILKKAYENYSDNEYLSDSESHTASIFKILPSEDLTTVNLNQLLTIFFLSGYYYSNFCSKNSIQIIKENNEGKK